MLVDKFDGCIANISEKSFDIENLEQGSLIFDARFESGNLGRVDIISNNEYDLFIRPDTFNDSQRVWFNFKVRNALPNQKVIFNIRNFSKTNMLFKKGLASPVVKEPGSNTWKRLKPSKLFYTENILKNDRKKSTCILTIYYQFKNEDTYQFAYCIPYTYTELKNYLNYKKKAFPKILKIESLGETVFEKQLFCITINNGANNTEKKQKFILITARVHPGETPSSHAMHGLIDFLCSNDNRAVQLRNKYTFILIPMLNPDGVILGNHRSDCFGYDLNRKYVEPKKLETPTIFYLKEKIEKLISNPNVDLQICIDIHSFTQKTNSFLIGNIISRDPKFCDNQLVFPYMMAEVSCEYSLLNTVFDKESAKEETFRRVLATIVPDKCLVYTYEISYFSYNEKDESFTSSCKNYTQSDFENCGKNICLAIFKYTEYKNQKKTINIDRSFETFLNNQARKDFKNLGKIKLKKKL